jgi:predicted flap endonuclease-1-like 5' DNA nuclease
MKKNKYLKTKKMFFGGSWMHIFLLFVIYMLTALVFSTFALTDTIRPTVVSVSPMNNAIKSSIHDPIKVVFSEEMDPETINKRTFIVMQGTYPEVDEEDVERIVKGYLTYSGRTATFVQDGTYFSNQIYGNVYTVTLKDGIKDLAGNSIVRSYVWSFTEGSYAFTADATTSQTDQSPSSTVGSTTPSTNTGSTTTNTGSTTNTGTSTTNNPDQNILSLNTFSWSWIIMGLLALVIFAVLVTLIFTNPRKRDHIIIAREKPKPIDSKEKPKRTIAERLNPFGDVHPVQDIQGIGPAYKKELQRIGINTTEQLWKANPVRVAKDTGAPFSSVKSWQNMAELASVKDIGPQYAELLERSGIHNITQLKESEPKELLALVKKKQDSIKINIQGNTPGNDLVENWIDQANKHSFQKEVGV